MIDASKAAAAHPNGEHGSPGLRGTRSAVPARLGATRNFTPRRRRG